MRAATWLVIVAGLLFGCTQDAGNSDEIAQMYEDGYFRREDLGQTCTQVDYTGTGYFPESPVPYPTPAGEIVEPTVDDIPMYPGSELLDSFVREDFGGDRTVQLYRTRDSADQVFEFFEAAFRAQRWAASGKAYGPAGKICEWVPYSQRQNLPGKTFVEVSTWFVGREDEGPLTPSPGYQGHAIPFASPEPGYTWFWVSSSR
jgi:hypothetical protein